MFLPDELSAELPARRDDEPADLRRDIVDELGDHLACAMRREFLTDRVSEGEAKRRVVARFGDPAAVVRRLWRDALWERIMSRRLLIGMCLAVLVICGASFGMTWSLVHSWQVSSAAQLDAQRAMFEKLMESSQKAAEESSLRAIEMMRAEKPLSDWVSVEYRFVEGSENGPPVQGVHIQLRPRSVKPEEISFEGDSSESGIIRFDTVRYGNYSAYFNISDDAFASEDFTILPGKDIVRTVVCPSSGAAIDVKLRIDWPDDLTAQPIIGSLSPWFQRKAGDFVWSGPSHDSRVSREQNLRLMPDGTMEIRRLTRNSETTPGREFETQHLVYEDESFGPATKLEVIQVPGANVAIDVVNVLIEKTLPDSYFSAKNAGEPEDERWWVFRLQVRTNNWEYQRTADEIVLKPSEESSNQIRSAIALIDQTIAKRQASKKTP